MIKINFQGDKQHLILNKKRVGNNLLINKFRYICETNNNKREMRQKTHISDRVVVAFMVFVLAVLLASCEKYSFEVEELDPEVPVLFQDEIQPIFTRNCISCHKGSREPDLRDGYSYESLTTGGYVEKPAESSELYQKLESAGHSAFTLPAEKQKIFNWIEQGAPDNK